MSNDYIETIVAPTIPNECIFPIEKLILTHIFSGTKECGNRMYFSSCHELQWCLWEEITPDETIHKALADSREQCPALCLAVEREIKRGDGKHIRLGAFDCEKIFHDIVKRLLLDYWRFISIEEFWWHSGGGGPTYCADQSVTLITPDTIQRINTWRGSETLLCKKFSWVEYLRPWDQSLG